MITCDILGGGGTCGGCWVFSVSCNSWLNTFSNEDCSVLTPNGAVSGRSTGRAGGGTLYTGGGTGWGTSVGGITGGAERGTGGTGPKDRGM
jgi:hypothetical protein